MADADVHIRRCDVRLIRSANDGATFLNQTDHKEFAARMQPFVLNMIEEFLIDMMHQRSIDGDIKTVDVRLNLPASSLRGAAPLARIHVRDAIEKAFHDALLKAEMSEPTTENPRSAEISSEQKTTSGARAENENNILQLLARWEQQRQLSYRLSLLGFPGLVSLFDGSRDAVRQKLKTIGQNEEPKGGPTDSSGSSSQLSFEETAIAMRSLLTQLAKVALQLEKIGPMSAVIDRLVSAFAALEQFARNHPDLKELTANQRPNRKPIDPQTVSQDLLTEAVREKQANSNRQKSPDQGVDGLLAANALSNGRYVLDCCLPFLVLLRLADHGLLDEVSPNEPALQALVFATALKSQPVLSEQNLPVDRETAFGAAVTAGLQEPLDGEAIVKANFANNGMLELATSAINLAMREELGRRRTIPALYIEGRIILFDPTGYFPFGGMSAMDLSELAGCKDQIFVLPEADTAGLEELAQAQLSAVCSGQLAAGETWQVVNAERGWRGMANIDPSIFSGMQRQLPALAEQSARALTIWQELTVRQPLVAPGSQRSEIDLDRTAAILAGFALADIAYILFGRNPAAWRDPDPLLAKERFGDMACRVDVSSDDVLVTLPLGARFSDLRDAGLLEITPKLSWFGNRTLRVSGG